MMQKARTAVVGLAVLGMAASAAMAQSTTQGAISGTVFDATGAAIGKATVTIHNDATNAEQTVTADDSGNFIAPLVEPGTYTVTISASGFGTVTDDNVIVQVGQPTTLEPRLAAGSAAETVTVSADVTALNFDSPDFSSVLDTKAIEDIPVNNRRWSALALTTPGVLADSSGFGLVSVRAMPTTQNNVEIDGADDNNAYYAEERGRTREAYSTSENAVREFAVNSGVYSAEFGRAVGAAINSVTKSGTNSLHGTAYFYDRESNWNAFQEFSTVSVANYASGSTIPTGFTSQHYKPEDLRKIYGFTVDGPIIKDKLFFMYTYDQHSRIFPATDIPSSPSTFYTLPDAVQPAGTTCTATGYLSYTGTTAPSAVDQVACTLAARLAAANVTGPIQGAASGSYQAGYNAYVAGIAGVSGTGQLGLLNELGYEPREGYQEINTPKLTWQVNAKNQVNLLFHRLRWDSPGGVQTASVLGYGVDTTGNDFVKLDYGVAKVSSQVSATMSNELLYQYGRELLDENQQPFSAYTKQNLTSSTGNVPEVDLLNYSGGTGFYMGSPYYSYRPAQPSERKWQIEDTMYLVKGNHTIKYGADILHNDDYNNALNQGAPPAGGNGTSANGMYYYKYYGNYLADLYTVGNSSPVCDPNQLQVATAAATAVGNYQCFAANGYGQAFGNPALDISTFDWAVFVQDNWKITPQLTLELGLRFDSEIIPTPPASLANPALPQTANHPGAGINLGPRVGFSYDLFGNGKTVVRGGWGLYYGRLTNGVLLTVLDDTGSTAGQFLSYTSPTASAAGGPRFPNNITSGGSAATPAVYYLDSHLKVPEVHEFDLQVQQEIWRGNVFSVSYMGALARRLDNYLNTNLNPTSVTSETITVVDPSSNANHGPLANGQTFQVPIYTAYNSTAYTNVTGVFSNINSSYNALVAEVTNRSLRHLHYDLNYTWSHALDYGTNSTTTTTTESWLDPYASQVQNYGNSNYNVKNRLVGYLLYTLPDFAGKGSVLRYFTNGWSIDTSFQAQNGLPVSLADTGTLSYTCTAAGPGCAAKGTKTGAVTSGLYGTGFTTYMPEIGRNTYSYPTHYVDDASIHKSIELKEGYNLELIWQVFNVTNHQNVDGFQSLNGYTLAGNGVGTGTATWNTSFLVPNSTNNSGFLYTPREMELAARIRF
jgi:hypothetical protein